MRHSTYLGGTFIEPSDKTFDQVSQAVFLSLLLGVILESVLPEEALSPSDEKPDSLFVLPYKEEMIFAIKLNI